MGKKITLSLRETQMLLLNNIVSKMNRPDLYLPDLLVEGPMGEGKTALPKWVLKILEKHTGKKWGFMNIKLAQKLVTDIQGIPFPSKYKNTNIDVCKWIKDPSILPGIITDCDYGIWMIDEFTQITDPAVSACVYEILNENRLGDWQLPKTWFKFLAGNRAEDGGLYSRPYAPIRDRLEIVDMITTLEEWVDWARQEHRHPSVISFIEESGDLHAALHTYDATLEMKGDREGKNYVFSSHRSTDAASSILYNHEASYTVNGVKLHSDSLLLHTLQSDLGDDIGLKLYNHYKERQDINMDEIYNAVWQNGLLQSNISTATLNPKTISYLSSVACYPTEDNVEAEERSFKVLMFLLSKSVDTKGTSIIINSYTDKQVIRFKNYLNQTNSASLYSNAIQLRHATADLYEALQRG